MLPATVGKCVVRRWHIWGGHKEWFCLQRAKIILRYGYRERCQRLKWGIALSVRLVPLMFVVRGGHRFDGPWRSWMGEEFVDGLVELVGVLDQGGMAGKGHYPERGFGNILEDFNGMLNRD